MDSRVNSALLGASSLLVTVALTAACSSSKGPATGQGGSAGPETTSVQTATATAPTSGTPSSASSGTASASLPTPDHVVVVVFENKEEGQVQDSSSAPYFNELVKKGASFTDWVAITHPSQPNYLAMFSGSTQGATGDQCLTPGAFTTPDLGGELLKAGKTFAGYSESMPSDGFTGCTASSGGGNYAAKHVPWVDFADVPASSNLTYAKFPSDYSKLPTVSFVIPNMCDDMHDCGVDVGDAWLKKNMSGYADWAAAHNSLLVVTFDEDDFTEKNVIPTTIVGAGVKPGTYAQRVDHYAFLRTLEDMYHLPHAGASAQAAPMTGLWTTGS